MQMRRGWYQLLCCVVVGFPCRDYVVALGLNPIHRRPTLTEGGVGEPLSVVFDDEVLVSDLHGYLVGNAAVGVVIVRAALVMRTSCKYPFNALVPTLSAPTYKMLVWLKLSVTAPPLVASTDPFR